MAYTHLKLLNTLFLASVMATLSSGACAFRSPVSDSPHAVSLASPAAPPPVSLIPYPSRLEMREGLFTPIAATHIIYAAACRQEAAFLGTFFHDEHGLSLSSVVLAPRSPGPSGRRPSGLSNSIRLDLDASAADKFGKEGYELRVAKDNIQIRAATTAGIFYGIQSLRQLISKDAVSGLPVIPCLYILDKPRFAWRSFMLDEGRYFKGSKVVLQLLDEMAYLKMNIFHWHLTDDQGWRIEIKKYPLLTTIGGQRDSSQTGVWPSGWKSTVYDGTPHKGFYTQQEIKEIVHYAALRHITIIPEIEMPGHASAAIAAYPFLGADHKPISVPVKFGVHYNLYNVADPRVHAFIQEVLLEVMRIFPSPVIHIGGDEVRYDQWKSSPQVMAYMQQRHLASPADLQVDFTNGLSHFLQAHGRRMMGWNEILGGKVHEFNDSRDAEARQRLSPDAIIQFWKGDSSLITLAAEKGYDIVNSYSGSTYLDYDYSRISLEKAYAFDPVPASLPQQDAAKILGFGCQMWGEWIPTVEKMNEHVYPRLAAYAETGWTGKADKDFLRFTGALAALETHWNNKGINYHMTVHED